MEQNNHPVLHPFATMIGATHNLLGKESPHSSAVLVSDKEAIPILFCPFGVLLGRRYLPYLRAECTIGPQQAQWGGQRENCALGLRG